MRIVERDGIMLVRDSPGLHWVLGLLFFGLGSLFVLGPLGLFTDRTAVAWPVRALSVLLGGVGVVVGLWVLTRSPHSMLEVDGRSGRVRVQRRGLGGRETHSWPIGEIEGARLAESKDDEGSPVFRVEIVLRSGILVPVSLLWTHGREPAEAVVKRVHGALGGLSRRGPD